MIHGAEAQLPHKQPFLRQHARHRHDAHCRRAGGGSTEGQLCSGQRTAPNSRHVGCGDAQQRPRRLMRRSKRKASPLLLRDAVGLLHAAMLPHADLSGR
mgnify:CR=1 FL=1